jgi:uncharacterized membrane protein SpoIIM required for sporulation
VRHRVCGAVPAPTITEAAAIFGQNALVAGSLLLGGLLLGLRLAIQLLHIGYDFALHFFNAIHQSGSMAFALAGLLPHGITELGALVAVGATGVEVAVWVFRFLIGRHRPDAGAVRARALELPVPLLALAASAAIEEFVTPWLMRSALGC